MIKAAQGAVLDATMIESAARPNHTITGETGNIGDPITFEDGSQSGLKYEESHSVDSDAA